QGADPLYPPPPASDSESEIEFEEAEAGAEAEAEAEAEVAPIPPPVLANPEPEAVTVGTGRLTPLKRLFIDTQDENRTRAAWRELDQPPYALPEALLAPVTHNDPRDPYIAARNAATAPATDDDDSPTHEETSPSEPQGSPPRDS
ncbi:hypothetical protein Tco_0108094, partial [Tanacetum coccineum]